MNASALSLRNATLSAAGMLLCAGSVFAADMAASNPQDRYRAERAACEAGRTGQDRATCLQEAGAALQERQRNNLNNVQHDAQLRANAAARCDRLPPERREGCMALRGDNVQMQGSVQGGAVLRQTTIREVGEPQPVTPAGGAAPMPGAAAPMPVPGAAAPMPGTAAPMPAPGAGQTFTAPSAAPGQTYTRPAPQPAPAQGTTYPAQPMNPATTQPMPQGTTAPYGTGTGTGTGAGMR